MKGCVNMEMLIKENEKFSKMLKKAIATGAVAVIVGGGAMVPVYAANADASPEGTAYATLLQPMIQLHPNPQQPYENELR